MALPLSTLCLQKWPLLFRVRSGPMKGREQLEKPLCPKAIARVTTSSPIKDRGLPESPVASESENRATHTGLCLPSPPIAGTCPHCPVDLNPGNQASLSNSKFGLLYCLWLLKLKMSLGSSCEERSNQLTSTNMDPGSSKGQAHSPKGQVSYFCYMQRPKLCMVKKVVLRQPLQPLTTSAITFMSFCDRLSFNSFSPCWGWPLDRVPRHF